MSKTFFKKQHRLVVASLVLLSLLTGCSSTSKADSKTSSSQTSAATSQTQSSSTATIESSAATATSSSSAKATTNATVTADFLNLTYSGTQTVEINHNVPTFTKDELSLSKGAWESYGDLDTLNRVTKAEAMLNMSIQPTGERGDISSVTPTGWKNKKLKSGYLYNRSHLIGYALAGENANVKNLMTGTAQLNNPEMLRHEMDIKAYIEQSADHYVRYLVEPIFHDNELVARGVHMMAQSVDSSALAFNVYIFNIQDGVTINYADGSSTVSGNAATSSAKNTAPATSTPAPAKAATTPAPVAPAPAAASNETQYVDANGNGLIKGSKSKIYHIPGSTYYDRTTNPQAMFKTVAEAEAAGYRAPKQ